MGGTFGCQGDRSVPATGSHGPLSRAVSKRYVRFGPWPNRFSVTMIFKTDMIRKSAREIKMFLRFKPTMFFVLAILAIVGFAGAAGAASVYGVYPFQNTGTSPPSQYGNGADPQSELLQASDGNFYGTTEQGGTGSCRLAETPYTIYGCGTVFRVNAATGAETVLFSFPYDAATKTAPDGAFPNAGLIQGKDGALYGVAQDGGLLGCDGIYGTDPYGCGTLFRITTTGQFTLLHQFCGLVGCPGLSEGAYPMYHLVQTADGTLYGDTQGGGGSNSYSGTLFSANTLGTVTTLQDFHNFGTDVVPNGALLVGQDGSTLYGVTDGGGVYGDGTVFSYNAAVLTMIYSFDFDTDDGPIPTGALIYGPDGLLYGFTVAGNSNGALYSLSTTGSDFAVDTSLPGTFNASGLLLGSDGMIYGAMAGGTNAVPAGGVFQYNPGTKAIQLSVKFGTTTGNYPEGALIEGKDHYLYGTNAKLGGSNSFGPAEGTLFRLGPPLK